jgi:hypothetical protein
VEAVFNYRPDQSGRGFWPQGNPFAATVLHGVHFFFDYVCGFAETSLEKFGSLHQRGPEFGEVEPAGDVSGFVLKHPPKVALSGQYIFKASNGG